MGAVSLVVNPPAAPPSLQGVINTAVQAAISSLGYVQLRSTPPDHTVTQAYVDISVVPPTLKGWDGTAWIAIGGSSSTSSGITITDLGNGTASVATTGSDSITDLGNGLVSIAGATVTDLGNGLAVAA